MMWKGHITLAVSLSVHMALRMHMNSIQWQGSLPAVWLAGGRGAVAAVVGHLAGG